MRILSGKSRIILVIIFFLGVFLLDKTRGTTFQELVYNSLGEDEEILYISISVDAFLTGERFTTKIEDPALIDQIINGADTELKVKLSKFQRHQNVLTNQMTIQAKSDSVYVAFNDSYLFRDRLYTMGTGNLHDRLFDIFLTEDIIWDFEPSEKVNIIE